MRSREFLFESFTVISEKTTSDEIIQYLEPLGFDTKKISGFTTKVIVPANQRYNVIQDIKQIFPDADVSGDGKQIKFDGATIQVKPSEAQGGRLEKEEGQIIDFFKQQGLQVSTPDLDAFRKSVQDTYSKSEYAKVWPNISQKGEPPADAKEMEGVPDKFEKFFSPNPGSGS